MTLSGLYQSTGGIYRVEFNTTFRGVSLEQAQDIGVWNIASFSASFLISTNQPNFSLKRWKSSPPSGPKIQPAWIHQSVIIFSLSINGVMFGDYVHIAYY